VPRGRKHAWRYSPFVYTCIHHVYLRRSSLLSAGGILMERPTITDDQLRTLAAEDLSQSEIAKRLGMPRTTVRDRLKKLQESGHPSPAPHPMYDPGPQSTQGIPDVHTDILEGMMTDLQDLVTWWRERKAALHHASDASRKTERTTFHVEQRWVNAIRR